MRKSQTALSTLAVLAVLACAAPTLNAQDQAGGTAVYRLECLVHKSKNGKRVDTRNYTLRVADGSTGTVRVGTRVPYLTGAPPAQQYQYADVGLNLDVKLRALGSGLALDVSLDISDLAKPPDGDGPSPAPTVRQIRTKVETVIPAGKATVAASLDDVVEKDRYDLEITATKVE